MTSDALPTGAGIGRVAFRVADPEETATFYEDVVGLDRLAPDAVADLAPAPVAADAGTDPDRVVLGAAGEPLLLLDHAPEAPRRTPAQAGLYHLAIRVPDRPTLGAAIARLRDRDLIDGVADHGVSEAIYCRDPAGNGVEIYADRPKESWPIEDGRVEMVTDPLDVDALVALAADPSPGDDRAPSLPEDTTIGHVHLEVTDLDRAAEFYVDALGMGVRQQLGDQALFLAAGDYHHHVGANTWRRRSEPAGEGQGLAWFEVVVPSADALEDAERRLEEAGVAVDREHDGAVLAVSDPDGIGLRLRAEDTSN